MLNNLFNRYDLIKLWHTFIRKEFPQVLKKTTSRDYDKIRCAWSHSAQNPLNWWNIPAVSQRINKLISGSPDLDHRQYIGEKFLKKLPAPIMALSPGCGTGGNEIEWIRSGYIQQIDAFDISSNRVEMARQSAMNEGVEDQIRFFEDAGTPEAFRSNHYDVIVYEGSLHHFYPIEKIFSKTRQALKPNGWVIVKDFVGPSRFQWTQRQSEIINGLLDLFPKPFKKEWGYSIIKTKVIPTGRLAMRLSDPSEAADSSRILPLLQDTFDILDLKFLGGTILAPLLYRIAHHFLTDDPLSAELLDLCFRIEDYFLKQGDISSDYICAVCQKK